MLKKVLKRVDIYDMDSHDVYLRRWNIGPHYSYNLKIHHILKPDLDRCEHDHPWWFWRIILWGGYEEEINDVHYKRYPWVPYFCPRNFRHRITNLNRGHSWTIVFTGPYERPWGFFTKDGWKHKEVFLSAGKGKRVNWCDT